jgi:hypothetical protein
MQYFKDRTESFYDYYPYSKKDNECNLDRVQLDRSICMHAQQYDDRK